MPLTVNVGLSRKASRDYQSTGVSINVTAELDQSLLANPQELQRRIDDLYRQAREAIDRRVGSPAPQRNQQPSRPRLPPSRTTSAPNQRGDGGNTNGGKMTASQRRAILSISERVGVDADAECRDVIGVGLEDLSLRQASEMIDHLKSIEPASGRTNGR